MFTGERVGEALLKETPPPTPHPRTLYIEKGTHQGRLFQCTRVLRGLQGELLPKKFPLRVLL